VEAKFNEEYDEVDELSHLPLVGKYINSLIHGIVNLSDD
jgi:hypothetical protein